MEMLFVGGPKDGLRLHMDGAVEKLPPWQLFQIMEEVVEEGPVGPFLVAKHRMVKYVLAKLGPSGKDFWIYVIEDLEAEECFRLLLKNYKRV